MPHPTPYPHSCAEPIEAISLCHPHLPDALEGLRILHLTDLHLRWPIWNRPRWQRLLHALRTTPAHLVALTGDLMDHPGNEDAALEGLRQLRDAWETGSQLLRTDDPYGWLGAFGIHGNHDSFAFPPLADQTDRISWLDRRDRDRPTTIDLPGDALLMGLTWPEDALDAALRLDPAIDLHERFLIALLHNPASLCAAADIGIDLMLAGHTHGGQIRPTTRWTPHTSSEMPSHLGTGLLRIRSLLCSISRGLGEAVWEGLRLNCPRQLPLYILKKGPFEAGEQPRDVLAKVRRIRVW